MIWSKGTKWNRTVIFIPSFLLMNLQNNAVLFSFGFVLFTWRLITYSTQLFLFNKYDTVKDQNSTRIAIPIMFSLWERWKANFSFISACLRSSIYFKSLSTPNIAYCFILQLILTLESILYIFLKLGLDA